ncbi:MAG: helix-turn-helix domain-containing protein [Lachnospiraceae bacterium]|nr:helix-turn-helix domain-containing protein [Ruminococcus sp.]MCM1276001.1 helix-turn-helix domain-containing protein [Lachnospiraceae bacterium]
MEIGNRLKTARNERGLTQEQVAEELGVSRQSVSNWENNRSYPDVVSVIKMSDLYSVSLDELLKGDLNMIRHLKETADAAKNSRKLAKRVTIGAYWACWGIVLLINLLTAGEYCESHVYFFRDAAITVIFAALTFPLGLFDEFEMRWAYIPVTGIMLALSGFIFQIRCDLLDISFYNEALHNGVPLQPDEYLHFDISASFNDFISRSAYFRGLHGAFFMLLLGVGCAAFGMVIGAFIRYNRIIKEKSADDKIELQTE